MIHALILSVAVAQPAELTAEQKAFVEASDKARGARIEYLEKFIDNPPRVRSRKERAELRKALKQARKQLRDLKKPETAFYPDLPIPSKAGDVGKLPGDGSIRVDQIVGENQALVTVHYTVWVTRRGRTQLFPESREHQVWLSGLSTAKWADEGPAEVTQTLRVTGNRTYETIGGGTNTVLVLEPFDVSWYPAYLKARAKEDR